jgi:hypothetical protein
MATASRLAGVLTSFALIALAAPPALAELYRWKDATGKEHFTSDPSQVPAQHRQPAAAAGQSTGGSLSVIESRPTPPPAPAPSIGGAPKPPAAAAPAAEKIGGDSEAGWRARVSKIRDEIAALEARNDECKRNPPGMPGRFDSVKGYVVNQRQLERAEAKADGCQDASSQLGYKRTELERLEERARVAGVPPGWLR